VNFVTKMLRKHFYRTLFDSNDIAVQCLCSVCSIMSLPAAYHPIEFTAQRQPSCALQSLANVIKRLNLRVFVVDVSSSSVRFLAVFSLLWLS